MIAAATPPHADRCENGGMTGPAGSHDVAQATGPDATRHDDPRSQPAAPPPPAGARWAPPMGEPVGERGTERDEPRGASQVVEDWARRAWAKVRAYDWPFDNAREAAEWWYRPLLVPASWVALGYLFVGAVLGPLLFTAATIFVSITFALTFVVVGLLLVVPTSAILNSLAGVERRRAAWVGDPIEPRTFKQPGPGAFSPITTRLSDPARWSQVAFFAVFLVAGPVLFAVAGVPLWFVIQAVFGDNSFGTPLPIIFGPFGLVNLALGALALGLVPRAFVFVAGIERSMIAWFLGPTREEQLEERVEELSTQREQILDAVAGERRRIERNLHDGVQQQLVALGIDIGRASARLDDDPDGAKALLDDAKEKVRGSIGELRMIGRGLHPSVLSDRGLDAALSSVVANAPIPITVDVTTTRELPRDVAETAYYVVNESVANVLKYSGARVASVHVEDDPGMLPAIRVTVHDDGRGGADPARGSGLAGMRARIEGVDGVFRLESPAGGPTVVTAVIPIRKERPAAIDGEAGSDE